MCRLACTGSWVVGALQEAPVCVALSKHGLLACWRATDGSVHGMPQGIARKPIVQIAMYCIDVVAIAGPGCMFHHIVRVSHGAFTETAPAPRHHHAISMHIQQKPEQDRYPAHMPLPSTQALHTGLTRALT